MSNFKTNLQYLRAQRNMTQEQLAMLLGVSRQAISKWESEKAYPEMDKLLMICDFFGVTLDDLVIGDVAQPHRNVSRTQGHGDEPEDTGAAPLADSERPPLSMFHQDPAPLPQDITGYEAHMRDFDAKIPSGIFAIIFGIGAGMFFDSDNSILGVSPLNDFLMFLCIVLGVIVGLVFLVPAGLGHSAFMRNHPYVEDFYTEHDRAEARRTLTIALIGGIGLILIGLAEVIFADEYLRVDDGWPNSVFLMLVACGVAAIVYGGMHYGRLNLAEYNKTAEQEYREAKGLNDSYDMVNGAICGTIMMIATIVGLTMLFFFNGGPKGMFWMSWVIGGLLCGISSVIIEAVKASHGKHDDDIIV
ncbi:XRE family transcriptional regulator [Bifidobacterium pseudolongum subsp. globosum]|uniref:XRE family transcriptional regulator n=1 Tax=Bifidobacterium pseudolongum subsp. globosum TaxID=1690 RepID=A0A2N3QIV8_9BIFI|nr:helix-turn-helix transcriptional regulator [Bifidobacterium pseudolongum]PKU91370.1 XRE family transcriptional regulator [Bifidobacterium pseudolongum subsp. globosum]